MWFTAICYVGPDSNWEFRWALRQCKDGPLLIQCGDGMPPSVQTWVTLDKCVDFIRERYPSAYIDVPLGVRP